MVLVRTLKGNELKTLEKYRELSLLSLENFERDKKPHRLSIMDQCQILLFSIKGRSNNQISRDLNFSVQTVRKTIHIFNEIGLKFICNKKKPVSKLIKKGNKYKKNEKLTQAITIFYEAIVLYPSSSWSYHYLGEVLAIQINLKKAIICFEQAIILNPTISDHYNKLGEAHLKLRQLDKAVDYFRKALSIFPNSAWYTQNLAEALSQQHKWGESVTCYRQALKLNPDEVYKYHNSLEIKSDSSNVIKVQNPIFIVGCGHSGTSIMISILSNHPSLYPITYESGLFKRGESEIREIMLKWDKECIEAGKKRWIEKTPPHIFQIKKFLLHRPNSKFILMLRDGRDVVCSLKQRIEYTNFEARVERWIYDNLAGLPYQNHPNVLTVKYEHLVSRTKVTLQRICGFLQEEYTDQILNYQQHQKYWYHSEIIKPQEIITHEDHHKLRNWQINQPIFDGSGRWKKEMSEMEKSQFKKTAQKYLLQFGYVQDANW